MHVLPASQFSSILYYIYGVEGAVKIRTSPNPIQTTDKTAYKITLFDV